MKKPIDSAISVQCPTCGLQVQVPAGGRRLCGCGTWLSGDREPEVLVEPEARDEPTERWPRIEGDLSAIERLNEGYRRITRELGKAIVGQQRVMEELLLAIFAHANQQAMG